MFRVTRYPMISKTESGRVLREISGSGSGSGTRWALLLSLNITTNHKLDKTKPLDTIGYQVHHGKTNFYHHCVCIHPHHPESHHSSLNSIRQCARAGSNKNHSNRNQVWLKHVLSVVRIYWREVKIDFDISGCLICPKDFDLSKWLIMNAQGADYKTAMKGRRLGFPARFVGT